jgi:hypothetical protein
MRRGGLANPRSCARSPLSSRAPLRSEKVVTGWRANDAAREPLFIVGVPHAELSSRAARDLLRPFGGCDVASRPRTERARRGQLRASECLAVALATRARVLHAKVTARAHVSRREAHDVELPNKGTCLMRRGGFARARFPRWLAVRDPHSGHTRRGRHPPTSSRTSTPLSSWSAARFPHRSHSSRRLTRSPWAARGSRRALPRP